MLLLPKYSLFILHELLAFAVQEGPGYKFALNAKSAYMQNLVWQK